MQIFAKALIGPGRVMRERKGQVLNASAAPAVKF